MTIIEQLEDADKILAADGYKGYSYVRIAISEAIRALSQPPVISRYFSCRFFKGQVLHSYTLQATDEDDARKKFKYKYRNRYNLLEISQI